MSTSASTLRTIRQLHLYFGVFIAPAILFFALTGALQTFSLHETTRGSDYKPPQWAVTLGQLHKKQTTEFPPRRPAPPTAVPQREPPKTVPAATPSKFPDTPGSKPKGHLPMKIFFLTVAIGLFNSTFSGIYMAYRYNSNKLVVTALLIAGAIIPILLLPF